MHRWNNAFQSTSSFLKEPVIPYIVESLGPMSEHPKPCFKAETAPSRAFSEYNSKFTRILS